MWFWLGLIVLILFLLLVFPCTNWYLRFANKFLHIPNLNQKAVVVSGCDSGFGRLLALKLLKEGCTVFAGCFTEKGEDSLRKESESSTGTLHTVSLDVTDDISVRKAADFVEKKLDGKGLWGLVNNAGIIGPTAEDSFLNVDHFKKVMDVNVYGIIRMVHSFKSLLKKEKGRIVNMSSCAGRVPGPGMGPYFMSKHAVESYSDTLRHELFPFGVTVHILEPQVFKTQLATPDALMSAMDEIWIKAPENVRMEFGKKFHEKSKNLAVKFFDEFARTDYDWVVNTYYHALTNRFPLKRYFVGWEALLFWQPLSVTPTHAQDWILTKVLETLGAPLPASLARESAKG